MAPRGDRREAAQRGIALIMVLVTLAVITVTTHDFVYRSEIGYQAAKNSADSLKAEYLARSVLNLSKLLFKVQDKVLDRNRMFLGDFQITQFMPMLVSAFFGQDPGVLAGFIGVDARDIHGLEFKKEYGRAYLLGPPEAEDGKINVNCAYAHSDKDPKLMRLVASLQALFADPRYDPLFEEADDQGNFNDRETVIRAIVDFVDPDQVMFGQPSAPEDYGYETLPDPYEAKNNLLDSVQDIRLIRGVTDDFWANFGPSLTIYGHCIPNICAIPDDNWMLMAAILYQSARNPQDPVFSDPIRLRALSQAVLNTVKISGCKDLNVLVQAARNPVPVSTMAAMLGGSTSSSDESVVGMLEGIELDPAKVMQAAYAGPRRYYRVVAVGEAGGVVRTITAVWDQQFRSPSTGQMGAFVYFRID